MEVIELSDVNNQLISTLNTSGWIAELIQSGKTQLIEQVFKDIVHPKNIIRTYLGNPITIEFLKDPNYWFDYDLNLSIFKNCEQLSLDPISFGKSTVNNNLNNRGSTILSIVSLVGIGPTLQGVQRINEKYNRSKTVKTSQITETSGVVELFYKPGFKHFDYVTKQNIGCYLAVLDFLQYEDVNFDILQDNIGTEDIDGYTKILFTWRRKSIFMRTIETVQSGIADRLFGKYVRSNSWLHKYHSELMQNYEYQLSIKEQLIKEREATHIAELDKRQAVIDQQAIKITETQEALDGALTQSKQMILHWFEDHHNDIDVKAQKLSKYLAMSESSMNAKLKFLFDATFKTLLTKTRLEHACVLLKTKCPTEVAYSVGYKTASHFSEVFKKEKNMTPSEFILTMNDRK